MTDPTRDNDVKLKPTRALASGDVPYYDGAKWREQSMSELLTDVLAAEVGSELTALASVTSAADKVPYFTGAGTADVATFTSAGRALVDDANAAAQRTTLGLVIGTDVQAQDAELAALAGLASAADKVPYFTGAGTADVATFTAAGRALVDDADASAQRTTLGLGTISTQAASAVAITGGTIAGTSLAGDVTGADAASTILGETAVASLLVGSKITLATTVAQDVVSISVPAGIFMVWGDVVFNGTPTGTTRLAASISATTATEGTRPGLTESLSAPITGSDVDLLVMPIVVSPATPTTYYLVANSAFTASNLYAYGHIRYLRVG